jgi:RNA polymerase sigma factor (sigma-70 family)
MRSDQEQLARHGPDQLREEFEAIVARHGSLVFGVGMRVLRDHHEAEDVVQLTFAEFAKHWDSATPHMVGWLHRTAMNIARRLLRSRVRRVRREAHVGSMMVTTRRDDPSELREEIDAALDRLSLDLREAVILHYLEDRDYAESARISGCSEGALRKRTQRGLHRLRDLLADRGIVCSLDVLTLFLVGESAVKAVVPVGLLGSVARNCELFPRVHVTVPAPRTAISELLRTKTLVLTTAAVVGGGALGFVTVRELTRWWWAAVPVLGTNTAQDQAVAGWASSARARFRALSLKEAATIASSRPIFRGSAGQQLDGLIPPFWGEFTTLGIPFRVDDPQDGSVRNIIVLYAPRGDLTREMPRSVSVPCGESARAIHLLSGVSGWGFPEGFPRERGKTVSMIVRLHYTSGTVEDHPLLNGVHFTSWITLDDVPGSKRALVLKGIHQMRYLAIVPERTEPIQRIEFLKGPDHTAPVVMAVTVEIAGKEGR